MRGLANLIAIAIVVCIVVTSAAIAYTALQTGSEFAKPRAKPHIDVVCHRAYLPFTNESFYLCVVCTRPNASIIVEPGSELSINSSRSLVITSSRPIAVKVNGFVEVIR